MLEQIDGHLALPRTKLYILINIKLISRIAVYDVFELCGSWSFHPIYQPVRRGTNGGVTKAGLLAAAAAGTVIGLAFVLPGYFTTTCSSDVALKQLLVIPLSTLAGLCGSVIDSLLGATLQFSGFCSVRNKVTFGWFYRELILDVRTSIWYFL